MRNMGALAVAGLLSHGALALPTPPRIIYPYPIYRSDGAIALTPTIPLNMDNRQGNLEIISAAFSRAVDVGFVTAVLRPHEHLVSFLRYYNPKELGPLSRTVSSGHSKRTLSIDAETTDSAYKRDVAHRDGSGAPGEFPAHDYRRTEDDVGGDRKSFPVHDYKRGIETTRSSTHSTSGEHLKAREVDEYPPRQPPVHNPQ
ncbi:hypothetical protein FRC06_009961 [Ceratobasidium sp. 370]|nr:hypothetical protein FRC06_009961 [Ceratobasidium sp. 370]